jgi:hypothetical protein
MDDDCEAEEDWLDVIADAFWRDPALGVVGGALRAPMPGRPGPSVCPVIEPAETLYEPKAPNFDVPAGFDWATANVAVRRSVALRVGPLDECLGPGGPFGGGDDPDWKLRLERLEIRMRSTPRSVVHHIHGRRYGLRAGYGLLRAYSRGLGALAAKLSMQSDPRGRLRLRATIRDLGSGRAKLPHDVFRAYHIYTSYLICRLRYRLDESGTLLEPRGPRNTRDRAYGVTTMTTAATYDSPSRDLPERIGPA